MSKSDRTTDRRGFLGDGARVAGAIAFVGVGGFLAGRRGRDDEYVWQLDPDKCTTCGNCATHCVLDESAVKAVQCYDLCAMCDPCPGYFDLGHLERSTSAENQLCPTGAVDRQFVVKESGVQRYDYHILLDKCIGCAKCVEGCAMMNGSIYLQIQQDRCLNCNDCSIALACPTEAFERIPSVDPYLVKKKAQEILDRKAPSA